MNLPFSTSTIVIGTKVAPGHYVAGKSFDSLKIEPTADGLRL